MKEKKIMGDDRNLDIRILLMKQNIPWNHQLSRITRNSAWCASSFVVVYVDFSPEMVVTGP